LAAEKRPVLFWPVSVARDRNCGGEVDYRQSDADRIIAEQRPEQRPENEYREEHGGELSPPPPLSLRTRFFATIELDPTRLVAKLHSIVDGILSELSRPSGAKVRLVLEIHADAAIGFPNDVVGVVEDNAKTLGFAANAAKFERE
jgi:hypothetical protein